MHVQIVRCVVLFNLSQHPAGASQLHSEVNKGAAQHVEEQGDLLASLHTACVQPCEWRGGATNSFRKLRNYQHATHADPDVSLNTVISPSKKAFVCFFSFLKSAHALCSKSFP